jgi:tetratricopeptide (TPR) repeat protein
VARRRLVPALVLTFAACASADTIVLTDGRLIEAEHAWFEGTELRYRRDGTLWAVPRSLVLRVDPGVADVALVDPDVLKSRESLSAGDAPAALRYARLALFRDAGCVPGLRALAAAQLALGDASRARESAQTALGLDPRSAEARELLGDALAALGDPVAAREQYEAALTLGAGPRTERKLETLGAGVTSVSSARFRIRYDGAADEPMGLAVLRVLDTAWDEYENRLGFTPDLPVTVVLQTATSFRDTTRAPEWVAAWNDGTIRVPVMGLERTTPGLVRVLRHELAHSFVASRAGANCPTWLHEGIAQWLEGGDLAREDAGLVARARAGRLRRLESLESPFVGLSEAEAAAAYAQSLSVVAYLIRLRGEGGLRRLIEALGAGAPAVEALPVAFSLSYGELQRGWEDHLRRTDLGDASAASR